jgi:P22 coat protein - gene protein 5
MEVLRNLKNALKVAEYFNSDWEKDYEKTFAVGTTITVKFPQQFTIRDGLGYNPQGINRISTTVSLDQPFGIDFQWDDYEAAVKAERSEEEIREQYLEPAGVQIANEIDSRAAFFAKNNISQIVGSLGTDPTSITYLDQARGRMLQKAGSALAKKRCALISSSMQTNSINNPVTSLFQPADAITQAFKEGSMGKLKTFDVFEEQNLYSHTAGTWAGAVTVTGAGQSGTSLIITGTNGDTIKQGDKFSVANVNFVNPRSRRIPGPPTPQTFTVTQDFTLTGGADTITMLPAVFGPGPTGPSQYQNVDALPANGAALTLWPGTVNPNGASGTVGLALSTQAFAIVGMRFYLPKSVEARSQSEDKQTGIPVRFVKAWDPLHSLQIHRFDTVCGFGNLYQDNAAVGLLGA